MRFIEKIKVIERVDALIKRKATGTADELAERIGVSRRCVYDIIDVMKQMDAPIEYSSQRKTFYYSYDCDFSLGFVRNDKMSGGKGNYTWFFCDSAEFLHKNALLLYYDQR